MSNIELIWKDFTDEISRLRVLKNIIKHSSEIQIKNYKKMGEEYNSNIKRYHHGMSFLKHKHINNKPVSVSVETESFNIKEYICLLEEQHNEQYKLVLAKGYESFKKFIKKIFNNQNEIDILIENNYTNIYHDSFKIDLFYVINIIRIMRNKISHGETMNDTKILYTDIENILNKKKFTIRNEDKSVFLNFISEFINNTYGLVLREKRLYGGGHWDRMNVLIDCLLSYSYHIKETEHNKAQEKNKVHL